MHPNSMEIFMAEALEVTNLLEEEVEVPAYAFIVAWQAK